MMSPIHLLFEGVSVFLGVCVWGGVLEQTDCFPLADGLRHVPSCRQEVGKRTPPPKPGKSNSDTGSESKMVAQGEGKQLGPDVGRVGRVGRVRHRTRPADSCCF